VVLFHKYTEVLLFIRKENVCPKCFTTIYLTMLQKLAHNHFCEHRFSAKCEKNLL
jgi:hypothetical protein